MMTPEDKAKLWLKRVSKWLNEFDGCSLSDPAALLLERLKRDYDRSELKKAWDIIDDLNHLSDTSEELESAEIRLQCGLVVAEMGNFKDAQKFFSEASSKYTHFRHHYAIAQWMKGCMEWLLPGKEVDAINSWREAEKAFEALRKQNESQKDKHSWYDARCKEMHASLHQAADKYEIPPLPLDAGKNGNPGGVGDVSSGSDDPANFRSDRMGLFSIYEHINAGSFGPSGILETPVSNLEIEQVFIDDKPFRILAIDGSRFFRVPIQNTHVIKVSGDSMNLANIQSEDYVLLRLLPKNFSDFDADNQDDVHSFQGFKDGDIVAAEIVNEEGNVATLKRVFRRGKKIVLQPQSTNPEHVEREFDATDKGLYICGVVQAVLKSI